jgi:hypothetical protein
MGEFLIDGCWILRTLSGVCLVEEIYTDFKKEGISKDLITGFLSAIVSFSEEAFSDDLHSIKFSNHKILLRFTEEVIFVIAISYQNLSITDDVKTSMKAQINEIIDKIVENFNEKYKKYLPADVWDGSVKIFEDFSSDLGDIVKREPLSLKLITLEKILRKNKKREDRRKRRKEEVRRTS